MWLIAVSIVVLWLMFQRFILKLTTDLMSAPFAVGGGQFKTLLVAYIKCNPDAGYDNSTLNLPPEVY